MVSNARTPEAEITGTPGAGTELVASAPRRRLPERLVRPILLVLALGVQLTVAGYATGAVVFCRRRS